MAKRFEGKVVVITGSSAGIGQDAAVEFAKEGALVVIHGQNPDRLNETENMLIEAGVPTERILKVFGSMEDTETPARIVAKTVEKFGRIDVLINNAGTSSKPGEKNQHELDNLDFLYKVNYRSVIEMTQLAMPYLEKTKGNVINVSSACSIKPYPVAVFYSSLKAGLDHFTRNYAFKYGRRGVRINCINPGFVRTSIVHRKGALGNPERFEEYALNSSLKRIAQPNEMSSIMKFLASDDASYVTGACWMADGGVSLHSPPLDLDEAMMMSI